ncbi:MAG: hypothetical protein K2P87_02350 [Lachnospiraceae bacterium]|nr:hypothetical protein [Lachnospiraceae bacterium]
MADTIKTIFGMCWGILGIGFQVYDYTLTLWQVLLFSVTAYAVAYFALRLFLDHPGGGE